MRQIISKVDGNQAEIVQGLRDVGVAVYCAHAVGRGFPDLVVAFRGRVYLLEVKTADGELTLEQRRFFSEWKEKAGASLRVVRTVEEALRAVGAVID